MSLELSKRFKPNIRYYGQLVIGPPGAGKTTYCLKMAELLRKTKRNVLVVNLDPANEIYSLEPDINIRDLIIFEEVMDKHKLGPNGALLFCMEYLETNIDWLINQINAAHATTYIFDLPGQVELYSHHNSLTNIFNKLKNICNLNLCVVHLVDSHHCSDAGKFISALMLSLSAMLKIGLPHVNILTKIDILNKNKDKLQFGIDFYTEVLDLNYLLDNLDTGFITNKYKKMNSALVSIIEDYSLVTFSLLNVFDEKSLTNIKNIVDKVSGYVFKSEEGRHINSMLACAMGVVDKDTVNTSD